MLRGSYEVEARHAFQTQPNLEFLFLFLFLFFTLIIVVIFLFSLGNMIPSSLVANLTIGSGSCGVELETVWTMNLYEERGKFGRGKCTSVERVWS